MESIPGVLERFTITSSVYEESLKVHVRCRYNGDYNVSHQRHLKHRDFILASMPRNQSRARIFKLLRSPRIDSKKSIPPAYVAWQAGETTLFLLGSYCDSMIGLNWSRPTNTAYNSTVCNNYFKEGSILSIKVVFLLRRTESAVRLVLNELKTFQNF